MAFFNESYMEEKGKSHPILKKPKNNLIQSAVANMKAKKVSKDQETKDTLGKIINKTKNKVSFDDLD